ncbi:MAG: polyprenol monophosphomannose synthase [Bacteroidales bacterium]|nr:polyprenol monophosphomannose synthase [Bacteroidales bacterium]MDD2322570.1 polyprenol monophosphomannose synthase [Bacteroidales bacterium]MDD3960713.1 polyprenol monophosphomannose synthase [Bacteroidales bacterium]MDY0286271.1 polyprenol monophosphomannose synthase [Bacteroidales bacterium]
MTDFNFTTGTADSLVIIPTYNEKENVEGIIRAVFSLAGNFHVLIVEDNSPDGTAEIVRRLLPEFQGRLFMEERRGKLGLGTAYIHGFNWALERHYDYIFEMDADFSHNPEDLLKLKTAVKNGADLAIGSRYVNGVNVVNWPMGRVLMSYYASAYVRMVTRMKVRDTTAGFKCYSRKVLQAINFNSIRFTGYAFQIEMKYTTWKLGFRIVEVPIIFTDRTQGESKMSSGIFREAILGVMSLRFRNVKKYHKVNQ